MNMVFDLTNNLEYINLLDYSGKDIFKFDSNFNYNNLKVCIKDYSQIYDETNNLKDHNAINKCQILISSIHKTTTLMILFLLHMPLFL